MMGTTCGVVVGLVEEGAIVEEGAVTSVVGEGTVEEGAVGAAFKVGAVGWGCLGVGSCGCVKDHVAIGVWRAPWVWMWWLPCSCCC